MGPICTNQKECFLHITNYCDQSFVYGKKAKHICLQNLCQTHHIWYIFITVPLLYLVKVPPAHGTVITEGGAF